MSWPEHVSAGANYHTVMDKGSYLTGQRNSALLAVPAIIPTIYDPTQLGLNGSRLGYLLVIAGTRLGMVIFLAAVVLPVLTPVLFTGAVMLIISVRNDFCFALFLLRGSQAATLPLTLYSFASSSTHGVSWNLVFAHVVLTSLPLVLVCLVLQRRVLAGLTEGGSRAERPHQDTQPTCASACLSNTPWPPGISLRSASEAASSGLNQTRSRASCRGRQSPVTGTT